MEADIPKQYLRLGSRTLLEHSVLALMSDPRVERVLVVVAPADRHAALLSFSGRVMVAAVGGASRAESVRNGLLGLVAETDSRDRGLVHEAAETRRSARDFSRRMD